MGRREKASLWIAGILTTGITAYSVWKLMGTGVLSWHITQRDYHFMMAEFLCLWALLFCLFRRSKSSFVAWAGAGIILAVVSWMHVIFLPVLFTGCYVGYLILVGRWLGRKTPRPLSICWQFLSGSALTILTFCLLSLAELGSIRKLRIWVIASGCLLMLGEGSLWLKKNKKERDRGKPSENKDRGGEPGDRNREAALVAGILALLLLQAARLNVAVDFDSLWYGVRSHVMLNSGKGIYENLGTLGVVYTYPKGWETLTLPLAGLPSYSFSTAMNLWVTGLTLLAFYETAALCMDRKKALWVPFLAAAVPGIMNMSGTAKADMMTLFCQVLMVQTLLRYGKGETCRWLIPGLAAGALSLSMKPTAVVFSTAIVGMGMFWLFLKQAGAVKGRDYKKRFQEQRVENDSKGQAVLLVTASGALVGIWGRTMHLVGVPVTSIFYQFFQKLGFQVKYPFYGAGFPSAGGGMAIQEQLGFLMRRLYGLFLNPQGEDMAHVIIAWGGILPLAFFILFLCLGIPKGKERVCRDGFSFLVILLGALLVIDLASVYSLSQIDGNYYMLTYGLVILAGCIWLDRRGQECWKIGKGVLLPVWCYGVILCGLTNWAWALGNGGIHLANKGYYPHIRMEQEKRAAQGSAAIWDILASDPRNRVIALGEHPGVLTFPCWVQSYVDVSGYWGNPEVVANAPNFLEYLQYADVDYLYMEKEYVDTSVRIYQIVRKLIQEGWLYDVRDENGNLILRVCKEETGCCLDETEQNLSVFDNNYIQHP